MAFLKAQVKPILFLIMVNHIDQLDNMLLFTDDENRSALWGET